MLTMFGNNKEELDLAQILRDLTILTLAYAFNESLWQMNVPFNTN